MGGDFIKGSEGRGFRDREQTEEAGERVKGEDRAHHVMSCMFHPSLTLSCCRGLRCLLQLPKAVWSWLRAYSIYVVY
jgi:hypothetical protein